MEEQILPFDIIVRMYVFEETLALLKQSPRFDFFVLVFTQRLLHSSGGSAVSVSISTLKDFKVGIMLVTTEFALYLKRQ